MTTTAEEMPGWERSSFAAALHRCDARALEAFYAHFRPILRERARLFGISPDARTDFVETFLGDILIALSSASHLPDRLHAYVFVSFKRDAARLCRARRRELAGLTDFVSEISGQSGDIAPQPALSRFASALVSSLTAEDRMLIGARAEDMPLRQVAAALGMNYNAANTRVFRLRSRLRTLAASALLTLEPHDRSVIERLLSRAGYTGMVALPHAPKSDATDNATRGPKYG